MLRRLVLSIIILSALASEGGAPYSAGLIDYYLVNLAHLDMMQDSRNTIPVFDTQKTGSLKTGTPAAFYKAISQNAISSKSHGKNIHFEFLWVPVLRLILVPVIIVIFIFINIHKSLRRRSVLSLADSSPPVCF